MSKGGSESACVETRSKKQAKHTHGNKPEMKI